MADEDVMELIQAAEKSSILRSRLAQDRTSTELAESAAREGYSVGKREAKKILAGAYLTSDEVSQKKKQKLVGGLSWNFLDKIESDLDSDFSLLEEKKTWTRTAEFYREVFQ